MPNLKAIQKRIGSVVSTQKITKAMKMVSAAKLRRAQSAILERRPYAVKLHTVLSEIALRAGAADHPLLNRREVRGLLVVVLTSDRGQCGSFNANIVRAVQRYIGEYEGKIDSVSLATVGRKGRDFFRRRGKKIVREFDDVFTTLSIDWARKIGRWIVEQYTSEGLDQVVLVYNEFKSASQQKVVVEQLLPIQPLPLEEAGGTQVDFTYEPSKHKILDTLCPMYVVVEVWRALLESSASEHGARMTAMDNATRSADDMIGTLTLQYNRARQEAITKELMDIVGGAEALRG